MTLIIILAFAAGIGAARLAPAAIIPPRAWPAMPALPANLVPAQITRVIDGDTVEATVGGQRERIRLIGIDTPERGRPCFSAASTRLGQLIGDGAILLEADPTQDDRDRYNRLLRYLWRADGTLLNLVLVSEGLAAEYTYRVPYKYVEAFRAGATTLTCK